jgi:hypothetical protein
MPAGLISKFQSAAMEKKWGNAINFSRFIDHVYLGGGIIISWERGQLNDHLHGTMVKYFLVIDTLVH